MTEKLTSLVPNAVKNVENVITLEFPEDPALQLSFVALINMFCVAVAETQTHYVSQHPEVATVFMGATLADTYIRWFGDGTNKVVNRLKQQVPENMEFYREKLMAKFGKNKQQSTRKTAE